MSWFSRPPNAADWSDAELNAAHAAAQVHVRRLRTWMPLGVLLIIGCYVLGIRATIKAIDGDKLGNAIEKRVSGLTPKVQKAVQEVGQEAGPVVSKALETEASKVLDQFGHKVDKEVQRLRDELPNKMQGVLDVRMRDLKRAQVARLQQELPELVKDPKKTEALLDALAAGTHEWARKQLTTTFQKHLVELDRLKTTLQKLAAVDVAAIAKADGDGKALPAGATPGDVVGVQAEKHMRISPEQMLSMWLEIFEEAINGPEGETVLDDGGDAKKAQPDKQSPADKQPPADKQAKPAKEVQP